MAFFDDLTKKVGDAAKTAAKKSGELVEITKFNMAISAEEDKIKAIYNEMGKKIYSKYKNCEGTDMDLISSCQQIDGIEDNIASLREKLVQIKNAKPSPNYGDNLSTSENHQLPRNNYIPAAGQPQSGAEQAAVGEQFRYTSPAQTVSQRICTSCGATMLTDAKFCQSCGAKL